MRFGVQLPGATLCFHGRALHLVICVYPNKLELGRADKNYGNLSAIQVEVRALLKADFSDLKEKHTKDVLSPKLWRAQKELLEKAEALAEVIGEKQHDDYNAFEGILKQAFKDAGVSLGTAEKKQLLAAVTWPNPDAEPVIKNVLKTKPNPMYGAFEYKAKVVSFQPRQQPTR